LLRRVDVAAGTGVAWGLESTPDVFRPDLIPLEDRDVVGYDATPFRHEFREDEHRTGSVVVGIAESIGGAEEHAEDGALGRGRGPQGAS
jgi:hypothetical protein